MENKNRTMKKLSAGIFTIVLLSICLIITTFALVWATVTVENNLFATGIVKINLNDGMPVIEEHEYLFEPGMTVEKEFFIENLSTWDVYYKLYFENVDGGLADVLEVQLIDGDSVLFSGKMADLTRESAGAADNALLLNEKRVLKIRLHFPEGSGNEAQNLFLSFDIRADAVQTKNNPDKLFN